MHKKLFWEVTEKCNLHCSHCYNAGLVRGTKPDVGPELDSRESYRVIDYITDNGIASIHFLGGEPFMRRDFSDLCAYARRKGCELGITTNGTILTERWLEMVGGFAIRDLYVSLDGTTAEVNDALRGAGTFDRVVTNVSRIRHALDTARAATDLRLAYTVTATNLTSLLGIPQILENYGFHGATIGVISCNGDAYGKPELTRLDQVELCNALDSLFQRAESFPGCSIRLKGFKPRVLKYFMLKYPRHGMAITDENVRCQAFARTLVLRADGMTFLCGPLQIVLDGRSEHIDSQAARHIPAAGIPIFDLDLKDSSKNPSFERFLEYVHSEETYHRSESCDGCEFYRQCQVCPIYDPTENGRMPACDWAGRALEAFKRSLLDDVPIRSRGITLAEEEGIAYLHGGDLRSRMRLNETGIELWRRFDGRRKLSSIIAELEQIYQACDGDPGIGEHVISFCGKLRSHGALHFKSGPGGGRVTGEDGASSP